MMSFSLGCLSLNPVLQCCNIKFLLKLNIFQANLAVFDEAQMSEYWSWLVAGGTWTGLLIFTIGPTNIY